MCVTCNIWMWVWPVVPIAVDKYDGKGIVEPTLDISLTILLEWLQLVWGGEREGRGREEGGEREGRGRGEGGKREGRGRGEGGKREGRGRGEGGKREGRSERAK